VAIDLRDHPARLKIVDETTTEYEREFQGLDEWSTKLVKSALASVVTRHHIDHASRQCLLDARL
jgi:hypothetical protein